MQETPADAVRAAWARAWAGEGEPEERLLRALPAAMEAAERTGRPGAEKRALVLAAATQELRADALEAVAEQMIDTLVQAARERRVFTCDGRCRDLLVDFSARFLRWQDWSRAGALRFGAEVARDILALPFTPQGTADTLTRLLLRLFKHHPEARKHVPRIVRTLIALAVLLLKVASHAVLLQTGVAVAVCV